MICLWSRLCYGFFRHQSLLLIFLVSLSVYLQRFFFSLFLTLGKSKWIVLDGLLDGLLDWLLDVCTRVSILANMCMMCLFKVTAVPEMFIPLCFGLMQTPAVHHSRRPLEMLALHNTETFSERSLQSGLGEVFPTLIPHRWPQAAALRDMTIFYHIVTVSKKVLWLYLQESLFSWRFKI